MTIKEVYEKCLTQGQEFRKLAELQKGSKEKLPIVEVYHNYATDFYTCAAWLEETEEINPKGSILHDFKHLA